MRTVVVGAAALVLAPVMAIGTAVLAIGSEDGAGAGAGLNVAALPDAAQPYVPWIKKSAKQCDGLTPGLLAAQLEQESRFNPKAGSEAGAVGIAQFLRSTYATYGDDSDGDGKTGPEDPQDAIMAQGKYMCSLLGRAKKSGYGGNATTLALAGYNAGWGAVTKYKGVPPYRETGHYVEVITSKAKKYNKAITIGGSGGGAKALRRAAAQLGVPYAWGGGSPKGPGRGRCDGTNGYRNGRCLASETAGFDCSSLTQYAYWSTRKLPRVAADQYNDTKGSTIKKSQLKPGDLLFWSKGGNIYHVALYYGDGKVLHAPRTGKNVEIVKISSAMPQSEYLGATRP